MVMAAYYQNRRMPLRPACGLHEDEPMKPQRKPQKVVPSFPLSVFPTAIRNIVEALVEYEHFNVDSSTVGRCVFQRHGLSDL